MKRICFFLIPMIIFSLLCAEDFVIMPKKNNVTSISSLKESCVTESSYALQKIAHINKEIIDQAIVVFEGKKLSKTELEAILDDLAFVNRQLDTIERKLATKNKQCVVKK